MVSVCVAIRHDASAGIAADHRLEHSPSAFTHDLVDW